MKQNLVIQKEETTDMEVLENKILDDVYIGHEYINEQTLLKVEVINKCKIKVQNEFGRVKHIDGVSYKYCNNHNNDIYVRPLNDFITSFVECENIVE